MNNTLGVVLNRLSIGFLFAVLYQIVVATATSILSIPLTGNISDLFLGIEKADSEGAVIIAWWIISTIIITAIALLIVKYKKYFSPYRNEKDIHIPPKLSVVTAIVIGSIISFMFFLMDLAIGFFVGTNATADVQAIYEAAMAGNFTPLYLSILFSIATGFIIVGVTSKTSQVSELTNEFGVGKITNLSRLVSKKTDSRVSIADTIGSRPGELIYIGDQKVDEVRIDLIEYDKDNFNEIKDASIESCIESKAKTNVSWVNIVGIHDPNTVKTFGDKFEVHPLHQANMMNTELRPSIEISENYILVMLKMPHFNDKTGKIDLEQISLVLSENHILTFQEVDQDFFDNIRKRLRENIGTIRTLPTDYLAYSLLDAVIDSYFLVLEKISDVSENLEDELVSNPSSETLYTLRFLKRQMVNLRKSIWPAREVLDNLQRTSSPLIHTETKTFLRDTYNHAVQIIDTTEGLRDLIGGMLDTYLSSLSNRMNEVMKTLTVIASIFIPITFIAGIYGTNFEYIPELQWHGSYFVMLAAMMIIVIVMLGWFKKRKWIFE